MDNFRSGRGGERRGETQYGFRGDSMNRCGIGLRNYQKVQIIAENSRRIPILSLPAAYEVSVQLCLFLLKLHITYVFKLSFTSSLMRFKWPRPKAFISHPSS